MGRLQMVCSGSGWEACMDEMELTMGWTDAARAHLVKAGFDPVYGARPLRRAIQSEVEDLVAEDFLRGNHQARGACCSGRTGRQADGLYVRE